MLTTVKPSQAFEPHEPFVYLLSMVRLHLLYIMKILNGYQLLAMRSSLKIFRISSWWSTSQMSLLRHVFTYRFRYVLILLLSKTMWQWCDELSDVIKYSTLILLNLVLYVCLDILGAHIWVLGFVLQNWVRQIGIKALPDCRTTNLDRNGHI